MENARKALRRSDKWYVGGGRRIVYAPPFPVWTGTPGFWDEAHFHEHRIQPVFALTFMDDADSPMRPRIVGRVNWTPWQFTRRFEVGISIITETCATGVGDTLVSELRIQKENRRAIHEPDSAVRHVVLWTIEDTRPTTGHGISLLSYQDGIISYRMDIAGGIWTALALVPSAMSYGVQLSEGSAIQPRWEITPFAEKWKNPPPTPPPQRGEGASASFSSHRGGLPNTIQLSGIHSNGLLYIALETGIALKAKNETLIWAMRSFGTTKQEAIEGIVKSVEAAIAVTDSHFSHPPPAPPPQRGEDEKGKEPANSAPGLRSLMEISQGNWERFFEGVPHLECSDPFIEKYFNYRWYGIHLNTLPGGFGAVKHPAVAEGIAYFRSPISYSAQILVNETRWMRDPALARGLILNFIENQRPDGSIPGILRTFPAKHDPCHQSFYHASWGRAVLELHKVRPDIEFLSRCYDPLARYARYFDEVRDPEHCGLYDVLNHFETGQEFSPRYLAVNENADRGNWGNQFRLKGVDAAVYMYEHFQALAWIAQALGLEADVSRWQAAADRTKRAVLELMWDPDEQMFFDVDPRTMRRTGVKAATCFYPYRTDIVSDAHLDGFKRHLFNPAEFWTPYPVPSLSADHPTFSAEAEWKGKRMACPWNGRVWPMTNSHIVDALGHVACTLDPSLKPRLAEFLMKYIRMMFHKKAGTEEPDLERPNCFEHYNPMTGAPSVYRGIDDYMHSWIADHIIRYVCGLQPQLDTASVSRTPSSDILVVDPLPMGLSRVSVENVPFKGRLVAVQVAEGEFQVFVDGQKRATRRVGSPVSVGL